MVPLRTLLAALSLVLPFPSALQDSTLVYFSPTQVESGWLGYACFPEGGTPGYCPPITTPVIVILPVAGEYGPDMLKNVLAHEMLHLYNGRSGPVEDVYNEKNAYRIGCYVSWVEMCDGWLKPR